MKELKTLLGMINYLAKFIPKLSHEAEPLRKLERKDIAWHWDHEQENAVCKLK